MIIKPILIQVATLAERNTGWLEGTVVKVIEDGKYYQLQTGSFVEITEATFNKLYARIDDTKGNGDTTYVWSANKVFDQLALVKGETTLLVAASDASENSIARADYVCDGTDDEVTIQSAIDALPAVSGKVILSEGNFSISDTTNLKGDIGGTGKRKTILKFKNGIAAGTKMFKNSDRTNGDIGIALHDMTLDGNRADNSAIAGLTGIDITKTTYSDFYNLKITGFTQHGIDASVNNSSNRFYNNDIDDYGTNTLGFGIVVLNNSHFNKVFHNNITSTNPNIGICIDDRSGAMANIPSLNNIISENSCNGMAQGITIAGSHYNIVKANTINGVTVIGIYVAVVNDGDGDFAAVENIIMGNIVNVGAGTVGISLVGAKLNTVIANIINGSLYGIYQGSYYSTTPFGNVLSANIINSPASHGIWIASGAVPKRINTNRIYNAGGDRIHIDTVSYTAGDLTPSVDGLDFLYIANSSAKTITNFDDGEEGQVITLQFADSNTTIDRTSCYLAGGVNFVSTANDTLTLRKMGANWYEVSRSVNA